MDLRSGVAIEEIADGGMLAGEVDGAAAVLVRRGKEIFAAGAECTHYHGNLAEGIVAGDTIRCPLHHACYDLRTGAATAPALAPIPVWNVEQRDGRVFVTTKRDIPPPPRAQTSVASVGIAGAGVAGNAAAEMLRLQGFAGTITMIGAEETVPIDRPNLSKEYLAGTAPEEWMPLRDAAVYQAQNIELLTGRRATLLDAKTKTLTLDDGSKRTFDAIVIATGSEPVRLSPPGGSQIHVLRTLRDSRTIIALAEKGKRAVVLGASFIGLEVAASLRAREVEVTVVAPDDVPLGKTMGVEVGAFIRRLHEEHGVRFRLGTTVATFEGDRVVLATGEPIAADFVVAGVGVRPNTQLAQSGGLAVDNGIVVDEYLQSSVPGIYAVGDLAHYPDRFTGERIRVEHWVAAGRQGQTAARNILGMRVLHTAPPFFWSAHYDVTIAYAGHAAGYDRVDIHGSLDKRRALAVYRTGPRLLAVAAIGLDRESLQIEKAMEEGDRNAIEAVIAGV
ncbi:MAG TPA: FAD-dependent oxidoreductase [Thermoanaerobaculia bacterium]|jgi:NADPH-dependent 2,4-dienoyl-CoA reductase/sulfur reductase-like enzyme/nitrite reductase/ring-hydroxylating ferredoxin subunit|nr:FAD-dependent oxidoreductase [Thermoanaerobaculia bacterium]